MTIIKNYQQSRAITPRYAIPVCPSKVKFKGTLEINDVPVEHTAIIKRKNLINDTHFFRDHAELQYISDYLKNNFPNGAYIADFACSDGTEAYSLAMLLANETKDKRFEIDKRYKITGYDIVPSLIERANSGLTSVYNEHRLDSTLINNKKLKSKILEENRNLFRHFFKVNKDNSKINKTPSDAYKLLRQINGAPIKEFFFNADKNKFAGCLDFKLGSISDIGKGELSFEEEKPAAIIFKNAWYHLTGNEQQHDEFWEDKLGNVNEITKNIHNALPQGGILVTGSLANDHIFWGKPRVGKLRALFFSTPEQKGLINPSPFHLILLKNGFEPDKNTLRQPLFHDNKAFEILVPTIWKKSTIPQDIDELNSRINDL